MILSLGKGQANIGARCMIQQPQRNRNGHIGILRALKEPRRERQVKGRAQNKAAAPLFDQAAGDDIGFVRIVRRQGDLPVRHKRGPLIG